MKTISVLVFSICTLMTFSAFAESLSTYQQGQQALQQEIEAHAQKMVEIKKALTVSSKDLRALIEKSDDLLVVDIREDFEREVSVIPGSISLAEFELVKDEAVEDQTPVVFYCTANGRSWKKVQEYLAEGGNGFTHGGVFDWAKTNYAFIDSNGKPTTNVHFMSRDYGLAEQLPAGHTYKIFYK